jgi:hypothetical protein
MKMINVFVLMLLLLATASWASAKTEEVSVGPFNVSFDLNTTENYTVTSNFTTQEGSQSGIIEIESNDGSQAAIGITAYDRWQYAGLSADMDYMNLSLQSDENVIEGSVSEETVDGHPAVIVAQTRKQPGAESTTNSTIAISWADEKQMEGYDVPVAKTKVEIISTLPENMTQSLLDTLHVAL